MEQGIRERLSPRGTDLLEKEPEAAAPRGKRQLAELAHGKAPLSPSAPQAQEPPRRAEFNRD